ncbi:trehalose-phosphatase [Erwinia tracheiphila]|uniref:trehalose-phosphatase n=1 Tax=Erwinia tracheiphila TaxID=65700 RepID=UPI00061D1563
MRHTIRRKRVNSQNIPGPVLSQAQRYAFFFDVDGTLADIQLRPDDVSVSEEVIVNLKDLARICGGAVALVSGRPISELDALVSPLQLPLAGVHGAERRDLEGNLEQHALPEEIVSALSSLLQQRMAALPGTQLEMKGMAFALHYRGAQHFQTQVMQLAESVIEQFSGLALQPGKCVVEIKPQGINKGAAVAAFMQQAPFSGKTPVFLGDDVTDEAAFSTVNAMQGISVKVGEGCTEAAHRLPDVAAVNKWLAETLLQLDQDEKMSVRS